MKQIRFTSLVETTMGPIEVITREERWWLSFLTFKLLRKIVSSISGAGLKREKELHGQWQERFDWIPMDHVLEKTSTFHTMAFRAKLWHKHMVEYAENLGKVISDHHYVMQLCCALQEAEEHDPERAEDLRKEIREVSDRQDRAWERVMRENGL